MHIPAALRGIGCTPTACRRQVCERTPPLHCPCHCSPCTECQLGIYIWHRQARLARFPGKGPAVAPRGSCRRSSRSLQAFPRPFDGGMHAQCSCVAPCAAPPAYDATKCVLLPKVLFSTSVLVFAAKPSRAEPCWISMWSVRTCTALPTFGIHRSGCRPTLTGTNVNASGSADSARCALHSVQHPS